MNYKSQSYIPKLVTFCGVTLNSSLISKWQHTLLGLLLFFRKIWSYLVEHRVRTSKACTLVEGASIRHLMTAVIRYHLWWIDTLYVWLLLKFSSVLNETLLCKIGGADNKPVQENRINSERCNISKEDSKSPKIGFCIFLTFLPFLFMLLHGFKLIT